MSNCMFRLGDRVTYVGDSTPGRWGKCGTVVNVDRDGDCCVLLDHTSADRKGETQIWCNGNIRKIAPELCKRALPTDSEERKTFPMFRGLLAYFPAALGQVSQHSFEGNEKHNPGKPMQHARGKSTDHKDCQIRHLVDAEEFVFGTEENIKELRANAWRALALLQEACEAGGCPAAPAATFD